MSVAASATFVPQLVRDLVRQVARAFYRDEYATVLEKLASLPLLREDDIKTTFQLPERQVRRVLIELAQEYLVAIEDDVTDKEKKRKIRGQLDWATVAALVEQQAWSRAGGKAPAGGSRKRARSGGGGSKDAALKRNAAGNELDEISSDSEDSDDGGGADGSGIGAGGKGGIGPDGKRERREKVSTRCYYINPRYFVDVVKYRLYAMRRHLEKLEAVQGTEAMFRCSGAPGCPFECSMLEAQQRRMSVLAAQRSAGTSRPSFGAIDASAGMANGNGTHGGGAHGRGDTSSTAALGFMCALCGRPLSARHVESVASAAGRLLRKMNEQLKETGITDTLRRLDAVALGANRPSDNIRAKRISLRAGAAAAIAAGGGGADGGSQGGFGTANGSGNAAGGGRGAGAPGIGGRVVLLQAQAIEVELDDGDDAGGASSTRRQPGAGGAGGAAGGGGATSGSAASAAPTVSADIVPAHLQRSSVTGERAQTLGFLQLAHGAGGGAMPGAGPIAPPGDGGDGIVGGMGRASAGVSADDAAAAAGPLHMSFAWDTNPGSSGGGSIAAVDAHSGSQAGAALPAVVEGDALDVVHDTNINAGDNAASAAAAAAAAAAVELDPNALWAQLFAQVVGDSSSAEGAANGNAVVAEEGFPTEAASEAVPTAPAEPAAEEDEWEDIE